MKRRVSRNRFSPSCCAAAPVMAQGQQSGTLGGRLSSSDSLGLPGATVTVVVGCAPGRAHDGDRHQRRVQPSRTAARCRMSSSSRWTACRP